MPVTKNVSKVVVQMLLNNGTDPQTGEIRTVTVGLGNINPSTYNADKAMAIVGAITPCLTKSLYTVREIVTSNLIE